MNFSFLCLFSKSHSFCDISKELKEVQTFYGLCIFPCDAVQLRCSKHSAPQNPYRTVVTKNAISNSYFEHLFTCCWKTDSETIGKYTPINYPAIFPFEPLYILHSWQGPHAVHSYLGQAVLSAGSVGEATRRDKLNYFPHERRTSTLRTTCGDSTCTYRFIICKRLL